MKRYNPGKFLREWFPNQTKTPLHIVIWTIVYLVDVALVFLAANAIGIDILEMNVTYQLRSLILIAYLLIALGLFSLEVFLLNKIFR